MERPLLVTETLIKPIASGLKTETRRLKGLELVNALPESWEFVCMDGRSAKFKRIGKAETCQVGCPYGEPGDELWVREGWFVSVNYSGLKPREIPQRLYVQRGYIADGPLPKWAGKVRPSIHMPRWLSRYTLQITAVTAERLHAITEDAAMREGFPVESLIPTSQYESPATAWFRNTWIFLNGPESWDANPWVWVIKFNLKTEKNATSSPRRLS